MCEEFISLVEDVVGRGVGFSDDDDEGEQPDERIDEVGDGGGEGWWTAGGGGSFIVTTGELDEGLLVGCIDEVGEWLLLY